MKLSAAQYAEAIYDLVSEGVPAKKAVQNLALTLRQNKASRLLPLIVERLAQIDDERQKQLRVRVISAEQLTKADQSIITEGLAKRYGEYEKIILEPELDEQLIGGIKLIIGDTVIDHTIQAKLNRLKKKL